MSSASKATSGSSADQKKPRQDGTKNKGKVGDWVRHTSSSGKEYYYNVITHASQWEKPREWLDHEHKHGPVPNVPAASSSSRAQPAGVKVQQHPSSTASSQSQQQHDRERDREHHQQLHQQQQREREAAQRDRYHQQHQHQYRGSGPTNSTATSSFQHPSTAATASNSSSHPQHASASTVAGPSTSSSSAYVHSWNTPGSSHHHQQQRPVVNDREAHSSMSYGAHTHQQLNTNSGSSGGVPPTSANHGASRAHYMENRPSSSVSSMQSNRDSRKPSEDMQSDDMDISPLEEDSTDRSVDHTGRPTPTYGQAHQMQLNSLMNLPGPSTSTYGNRNLDRERDRERERERNLDREDRERDSYRNYHRDRIRGSGGDPREGARKDRERDRNDNRDRGGGRRDHDILRDPRDKDRDRPRNNNSRDERSRSPGWDKDRTPERQGDATLSLGLSSLETAKEKEIPELPSSLAIYFREDLIAHVKNLPGEGLERQANKLMDDLLTVNSIALSKVSSELKMARSLVRLTDIQATLQEQKILFLRQQIKDLEESDTSSGLGMEPATA